MATFRATIRGNRGEASRLGSNSISADINGWSAGVSVEGRKLDDGTIVFAVYRTSGSNGGRSAEKLAEFSDAPNSTVKFGEEK